MLVPTIVPESIRSPPLSTVVLEAVPPTNTDITSPAERVIPLLVWPEATLNVVIANPPSSVGGGASRYDRWRTPPGDRSVACRQARAVSLDCYLRGSVNIMPARKSEQPQRRQ